MVNDEILKAWYPANTFHTDAKPTFAPSLAAYLSRSMRNGTTEKNSV